MARIKDQMEKIYSSIPPDKIPWNLDTAPDILKDLVNTEKIRPCRAIEFGCGTGNYVLYLAGKGFDVTGVDISESAICLAETSAASKKVSCRFIRADVLGTMSEIKGSYDFAYDWELLHHIFPEDRKTYIENVHRLLHSGGRYMSVCFSEGSPQFGGTGKYRKTPLGTLLYFSSEGEMTALFRPFFEIRELATVEIEGRFSNHTAIYAFMEKK